MQATEDTTYNGWKNYETWAVGMYLDGNYTGEGTYRDVLAIAADAKEQADASKDEIWATSASYLLASELQSYVQESIGDLGASLAADLLSAALSSVDWRELAEHKLSEVAEDDR